MLLESVLHPVVNFHGRSIVHHISDGVYIPQNLLLKVNLKWLPDVLVDLKNFNRLRREVSESISFSIPS